MTHKEILAFLGTSKRIAAQIDAISYVAPTPNAVKGWKDKGHIPVGWRLQVKRIANDAGLELDNDFLLGNVKQG